MKRLVPLHYVTFNMPNIYYINILIINIPIENVNDILRLDVVHAKCDNKTDNINIINITVPFNNSRLTYELSNYCFFYVSEFRSYWLH